jgi:hypothetical protein
MTRAREELAVVHIFYSGSKLLEMTSRVAGNVCRADQDRVASYGGLADELEMIWKVASLAQARYYLGICLDGLRKSTKTFSQGNRYPGRCSNDHLPNTLSELYRYTNLLGHIHEEYLYHSSTAFAWNILQTGIWGVYS